MIDEYPALIDVFPKSFNIINVVLSDQKMLIFTEQNCYKFTKNNNDKFNKEGIEVIPGIRWNAFYLVDVKYAYLIKGDNT